MQFQQQFIATLLLAVSAKRPKLEQIWDQTVSLPLPMLSISNKYEEVGECKKIISFVYFFLQMDIYAHLI